MIRLKVDKKIYDYERIIFPRETVKSKCDIIRYMRFYKIPFQLKNVKCDDYRTLVTNLLESEDEIRARYDKNVRYEVRRARREKIQYFIYDNLNLIRDRKLITDVEEKYYQFCEQIQHPELKHNMEYAEFELMIQNGNIIISKAEFENGWVYHIYQADGENALLWFSFSDYRKEGVKKSVVGWANRGLHDYDIMFFKEKGYSIYDWGNIASEVAPNEIDKFKMSFGGELQTAYCYFYGNTLKGKLLIKFRELKNKGKLLIKLRESKNKSKI